MTIDNHRHTDDTDDRPTESGTEGGSTSSAADRPPGAPARDDDSPLGDTDQHSTA